jgi:hypothetical protein
LPDLDARVAWLGSDVNTVRTCPDGWPGPHRLEESEILVVGDSFATGVGVDVDRTYWAGWDQAPRIKAVACPAYDLVQEFLLIEEIAARPIAGKLVVWLICTDNDLYDANRPSYQGHRPKPQVVESADGGWTIDARHLAGEGMRRPRIELGRFRSKRAMASATELFYWSNFVSDRTFGAVGWLIARAAKLMRDAGAELVVATVPYQTSFLPGSLYRKELEQVGIKRWDKFDPHHIDRRIGTICQSQQVRYLSGASIFGFFDYLAVNDSHLNERGHKKLRRALLGLRRAQASSSVA